MSKWKRSSEALKEHFATALEEFEEIERRKMFGYPCCFVNGNMFTGLHEESWIVRLPEDEREAFKEAWNAHPLEPQPGRIMREYLKLPKKVLVDPEELDKWLNKSFAYAASLPPKEKKKKS